MPSMAKGLGRRDLVQDLETGVRLEYSGGPNINTRILSKGRQEMTYPSSDVCTISRNTPDGVSGESWKREVKAGLCKVGV